MLLPGLVLLFNRLILLLNSVYLINNVVIPLNVYFAVNFFSLVVGVDVPPILLLFPDSFIVEVATV